MSIHVKSQIIKRTTQILLRDNKRDYLPAGAHVKVIQARYLPKDFDIRFYAPSEVVVYSQFGIGVIDKDAVKEE